MEGQQIHPLQIGIPCQNFRHSLLFLRRGVHPRNQRNADSDSGLFPAKAVQVIQNPLIGASGNLPVQLGVRRLQVKEEQIRPSLFRLQHLLKGFPGDISGRIDCGGNSLILQQPYQGGQLL